MYCINCGNKLDNNYRFCSNCGTKIEIQKSQLNNINSKKNDKLNALWIICAVGLIVISFVILFSGVVIGVGSGYENPDSSFDFEPFGIGFVIINGINIVFNIVMLIIKKSNKRSC